MGQSKRGRPLVEDELEETPNSSKSMSKKARFSGSVSSSQLDNATSPRENYDGAVPPSTQHEIDRDAGFAHLENAALDDARATQKLLKRSEVLGENHAADNGVIESVTMVNFMCHEKLHVTLGPLINFIIGKNGSGKSAILTAITLCLGGKASTTNRGGSLKSFIKEGRDQASLIIHLRNQGVDAYQRDIYGKTIIVERNFSRNGTSGFKLKSESARLVSSKKSDVDEIIEYFQMQIDNPMSVLTQDSARQFITSSSPAVKYRYFVKGVQLEQLDNDYRLVCATADAMAFKLDANRSRVKKLEQNAQLAKEKADRVKKHAGMRAAVKKLNRQAAWAQVENQERKLQGREATVMEAQKRIEEAEREVDTKDMAYQQTSQASERAASAIQKLLDDLAPLKDDEAEAKAANDAATLELHSLHSQHRQIKGHLTSSKNKVEAIQKDIDIEQQRIEQASGARHTKKLAGLDLAQKKVVEIKARIEESSSETLGLEDRRQRSLEEVSQSKVSIDRKQKEIAICENQLQQLNSDAGQHMAGFDPKISKLLKVIENDSGFREKPVGPIGLNIKLLKPIWSNVLERSIGSILSGFIVTSKADQIRLSEMTRRQNIDFCPIMIGNHHPINTVGHEPDEQYDTVLRVLEIDNDLVRRQLIINQGIEQTILIENMKDAMGILYDGPKPRNVKQCFCLHDTKRGHGLRYGYMPGSQDPSVGPIKPTGQKPRMKTDADSQIAYQRDTLQHLRREKAEFDSRERDLQQIMSKNSQAVLQHKRSHEGLLVQLQRAEEEVERLQEEVDKDNVEDGRLEAFKKDLQEAEEEFKLHGGSYGEASMAKDKQNLICVSRKGALDSLKEVIAEHELMIKKAENKSKRHQQVRQIALQEKNNAVETVNDAKQAKESAGLKRDQQAETVLSFIDEATKVCPRIAIDPGETAESIDAKLDTYTNALTKYNRELGGTDEEIQSACEAAVRAHQMASSQLIELETLLRLLKKTYLYRLERWRQFQRYISARSRTNFTYLLSERGFRGKLMLDHEAHLLDVQVEPDETTKSSSGRATKTLSGGEKSFSSVCLLLSVWEAMGVPLRCLDEYDVFMDHVNRDVSTSMIISAARRSVGRQFILITPQALTGVKQDKDVKFISLGDPRQGRLADL